MKKGDEVETETFLSILGSWRGSSKEGIFELSS